MPDEIRYIIAFFVFVLGACFASFGGVVAYRTPKGISIIKPDSYCPTCKKPIRAIDNIPILSWLFLGGRCRYCKSKIGIFSMLCELFGGIGFLFAYIIYGNSPRTLPICISLCVLVFLFVIMAGIDHETHDVYNITLIIFAVISAAIAAYRVFYLKDSSIWSHLGGAALGLGFFGIIAIVAKFLMKREALGSGDIYIVMIGGLMLGAMQLLLAILVSTLLGSVIELVKLKRLQQAQENPKNHNKKHKMQPKNPDGEIAFAPYLLLGIAALAIFGDWVMDFYWEVLI